MLGACTDTLSTCKILWLAADKEYWSVLLAPTKELQYAQFAGDCNACMICMMLEDLLEGISIRHKRKA